jgi:hypothetical protein
VIDDASVNDRLLVMDERGGILVTADGGFKIDARFSLKILRKCIEDGDAAVSVCVVMRENRCCWSESDDELIIISPGGLGVGSRWRAGGGVDGG